MAPTRNNFRQVTDVYRKYTLTRERAHSDIDDLTVNDRVEDKRDMEGKKITYYPAFFTRIQKPSILSGRTGEFINVNTRPMTHMIPTETGLKRDEDQLQRRTRPEEELDRISKERKMDREWRRAARDRQRMAAHANQASTGNGSAPWPIEPARTLQVVSGKAVRPFDYPNT